ncbi:hypothetical protein C8F04DRAFT_1079573, partial [Mycena alexandri]
MALHDLSILSISIAVHLAFSAIQVDAFESLIWSHTLCLRASRMSKTLTKSRMLSRPGDQCHNFRPAYGAVNSQSLLDAIQKSTLCGLLTWTQATTYRDKRKWAGCVPQARGTSQVVRHANWSPCSRSREHGHNTTIVVERPSKYTLDSFRSISRKCTHDCGGELLDSKMGLGLLHRELLLLKYECVLLLFNSQ